MSIGDGAEKGRDVFIAFFVRRSSEIKITAICLRFFSKRLSQISFGFRAFKRWHDLPPMLPETAPAVSKQINITDATHYSRPVRLNIAVNRAGSLMFAS